MLKCHAKVEFYGTIPKVEFYGFFTASARAGVKASRWRVTTGGTVTVRRKV